MEHDTIRDSDSIKNTANEHDDAFMFTDMLSYREGNLVLLLFFFRNLIIHTKKKNNF